MPMVLLDRQVPGLKADTVGLNNRRLPPRRPGT